MALLRTFFLRLITTIITLFGVAMIVFVVIRVVPGNPIAMMLPPGATEDDIAQLQALYGFDKSILEQFIIWLSGVVQGDFGTSISTRQPVIGLVLNRLPATLELSIISLIFAVLMGGTMALLGTRFRDGKAEGVIDVIAGMALSIPDFLWGLILILLFGVLWPVFHISGRISPALNIDFSTQFYLFEAILRLRFDVIYDLIGHMLMPSLALAIPLAAIIAQLLETITQRNHASRLRDSRPYQRLFRGQSHHTGSSPKCHSPNTHVGRCPVYIPNWWYRDH